MGKITGFVVTVGLNRAVIVRSGVGNTIGVGEATNGKLQAKTINPNIPMAINTLYFFVIILSSQETDPFTLIIEHHQKETQAILC